MKHRRASLLPALVLALTCLSPALALEPPMTQFADVAPDAWYAQAVALCAQEGIMVGTGEDVFSPEETLSYNQCLTLALRLHDLSHGGDGEFAPAPEDWGKVTLTLADGTSLTGYSQNAAPLPGLEGAQFRFLWGMWRHTDYGYLCAELEPAPGLMGEDFEAWKDAQQAGQDWGKAREGAATVQVGGMTVPGTVQCWMPVGNWVLVFHPDAGDDSEGGAAIRDALDSHAPTPDAWWRDGAWYLSQHEALDSQFTFYDVDQPALRRDFAKALYAAAGELPAVRQVDAPDLETDYSALYDAGILTGTDAYGTFNSEGRLTRAQAAVMVARVLDESQRVTTPLEPLPTEGYTLTYLMDGGVPGSGVTYPVCALVDWEGNQGHSGILLLDGTLLPWPEHASILELCGDYVFFGVHDETTEDPYDSKTGLMDRSGQFVVPMENMRTVSTYAIDGGFFSEIMRPDGTTVWTVLDEQGQFVRELPVEQDDDGYPIYPYQPKGRSPYRGIEDRYSTTGEFEGAYYVDANGSPVSQKFDWAGHITDDGQGFAGLDGKIYRIDFAQ